MLVYLIPLGELRGHWYSRKATVGSSIRYRNLFLGKDLPLAWGCTSSYRLCCMKQGSS